jgi:hypothetical protein
MSIYIIKKKTEKERSIKTMYYIYICSNCIDSSRKKKELYFQLCKLFTLNKCNQLWVKYNSELDLNFKSFLNIISYLV